MSDEWNLSVLVVAALLACLSMAFMLRASKYYSEMPRPLIASEKLTIARPGDTVVLLLKLYGMTQAQQKAMLDSVAAMVKDRAPGVNWVVIPEHDDCRIIVAPGSVSTDGG